MLVVVGVVIFLAVVLWLVLFVTHDRGDRRKSCNSNLGQIVKACTTYQEPNGDYFPAFWDGVRFDPMNSLAMLYPAYLDKVKYFGCPATKDRPVITVTYAGEKDKRCAFGAVDTDQKCSYFYDERSNPRAIGPGQAMACDADGQTWLSSKGKLPAYPSAGWTRKPRKPNHDNSQNVMYFDGHVKWMEDVYASRDPADNIFCPQAGWGADTDAYLWDGVNARPEQSAEWCCSTASWRATLQPNGARQDVLLPVARHCGRLS